MKCRHYVFRLLSMPPFYEEDSYGIALVLQYIGFLLKAEAV